jgi:methionyl-tRNA formyltransferase
VKIIFMGTPDFACPTLEILANSHHEVTAVFTQKSKPKNRGHIVSPSPVALLSEKYEIPLHCPETLKTDEALELINSIEADIIVVAAYGFIIPKKILEAKKYGCINLHPSSLPRFRGAAPLHYTILNGDTKSSICIIKMDEGLDTGPILLQEDFDVPERATLSWIHEFASTKGAELILKTIDNIDTLVPTYQNEEGVVYAHKLSKEDRFIDFNMTQRQIDCKIRAYNPWPGSFIKTTQGIIKIIEAEPAMLDSISLPGQVIDPSNLIISCKDGSIKLSKIQLEGKKPITAEDFYNGYGELLITI